MIRIVTLSNKPDYLQDCLECVRVQTRRAEHCVITDNCIDWGDRFPPSAWLNDQWQRADPGDYVTWLSDDDYIYPDAIERLAAYLDEHPDIQAVYGLGRHVLYERGRGVVKVIRFLGQYDGVFGMGNSPVGKIDGSQILVRRSALDSVHYPWQPEGYETARICDGLLTLKIAEKHNIHPLGGPPTHEFRTTPVSMHTYMADDDHYRARDWRS